MRYFQEHNDHHYLNLKRMSPWPYNMVISSLLMETDLLLQTTYTLGWWIAESHNPFQKTSKSSWTMGKRVSSMSHLGRSYAVCSSLCVSLLIYFLFLPDLFSKPLTCRRKRGSYCSMFSRSLNRSLFGNGRQSRWRDCPQMWNYPNGFLSKTFLLILIQRCSSPMLGSPAPKRHSATRLQWWVLKVIN